ncbi:hypothetical protein SM11_pC1645 (plasmid) [Sinorhizobium meliloti SM11]|uniref:Uncharacterized protein n=1 Tax=Sinorhizobium meliloti (strain SM11) TaxID=707241 RepID=F7XCU3_SINMM|nr:hypothetical protein SM11_pC1645 [Sinorhizobium meliloti SM11]
MFSAMVVLPEAGGDFPESHQLTSINFQEDRL